jgi:hypothetical protein
MAGYVATARLGAGAIRVDRPQSARVAQRPSPGSPATLGAGAVSEALEDVRVVRSWTSHELSERWMAIRETWTQTTFFLFHPESWR